MRNRILLIVVAVLVVIQFFQIDKTSPEKDPTKDFLAMAQPPQEIETLIRQGCYDCHSYDTKYPWYTYINPLGWLIKDHIEDGRAHLNFAIWTDYSPEKRAHKLEECYEEIQEGEMPFRAYANMHPEAQLSDEQRVLLANWFRTSRPLQVAPPPLEGGKQQQSRSLEGLE